MNAKDILAKIKAVFAEDPNAMPPVVPAAPAMPEPVAPAPFKLKDGTEIMIGVEDPAVSMTPDTGDMVTIAGAPAPAGDYELEDGSTFTVDAMGAISVYTALAPVTQPDFEAPAVPTLEDRVAALEAKQGAPAIPAGMATQIELKAASQRVDKFETLMPQIIAFMEMISAEPAADPKTLPDNKKDGFAEQKERRLAEKAEALRKMRSGKV